MKHLFSVDPESLTEARALFVFEAGDPETARSIGVGLSPGDGSFSEPYFYCSPYPAPDSNGLPALSAPLFWNTEGFVAVILRSSDVNQATDLNLLLNSSFASALHAGVDNPVEPESQPPWT